MRPVNAIVVAGGEVSQNDPLMVLQPPKGKKALLDLAGRPLAAWVVASLLASPQVRQVVVVGLPAATLAPHAIPTAYLPDQGGLIPNVIAGMLWIMAHHPDTEAMLLASGDIPLLTVAAIDDFLRACMPYDCLLYATYVPRQQMEADFPGSRRTYIRLKNLEGTGGNLFLLGPGLLQTEQQLWEELTHARKHPWKVARVIGLGMMLRLLLRQLTIPYIEDRGKAILGGPIRLVETTHTSIAMDVDKPEQLEMVRQKLQWRDKAGDE